MGALEASGPTATNRPTPDPSLARRGEGVSQGHYPASVMIDTPGGSGIRPTR